MGAVRGAERPDWRPAGPLLALKVGDSLRATDDATAVVVLVGRRGSVQVDAGSQISADAQGYTASQGPGGGVTYYTGGTHGGSGSGNPAPTYGSYLAPIGLGSGGMTYGGAPSNGGGAIRLIVSGALTNNGTITANGGAVIGTGAGAAGGSIYVTAGVWGGTGAFTAGGSTPSGGATAFRGGGRIAICPCSLSALRPRVGGTTHIQIPLLSARCLV